LKVIHFETADEFQAACRDWLMENEDANNGLLDLVELLSTGHQEFQAPYWFGTINDSTGIVGCAIHAMPDGLVMSNMPNEAVEILVRSLGSTIKQITRAFGPTRVSSEFSRLWGDIAGSDPEIETKWRVYRLDHDIPIDTVSAGNLRLGKDDDIALVREWGQAYGEEKVSLLNVADFMVRKLTDRDLYIWHDKCPRTLITLSGRSKNGVRISAVYTPPKHRGQGYASAAVSNLSNLVLRDGFRFVTLSAEIDDPAERVYKRLGYNVIGNRACYKFNK
jgi:hypothetical protein